MTEPTTVEVRIREARLLLGLAIAAMAIAALYVAKEVFIPITLAVILSFILSPLVDALGRLGLWRAAAVVASVLVALGAIGLVAPSMAALWYFGALPGPLALLFAIEDSASWLWTLLTWRAEHR